MTRCEGSEGHSGMENSKGSPGFMGKCVEVETNPLHEDDGWERKNQKPPRKPERRLQLAGSTSRAAISHSRYPAVAAQQQPPYIQ